MGLARLHRLKAAPAAVSHLGLGRISRTRVRPPSLPLVWRPIPRCDSRGDGSLALAVKRLQRLCLASGRRRVRPQLRDGLGFLGLPTGCRGRAALRPVHRRARMNSGHAGTWSMSLLGRCGKRISCSRDSLRDRSCAILSVGPPRSPARAAYRENL
jgi:hypothetical protein